MDGHVSFRSCLPPRVSTQRVQFARPVEGEQCFSFDNPGARICFRTDARNVTARLTYNGLHTLRDAANGVGAWLVDGQLAGTFDPGAERPIQIEVILASEQPRQPRDYEIVLPYGDSVDFDGLVVSDGALFLTPAPPLRFRYLAYGDSITQGFWASDVTCTFPYRIEVETQWEVINLGFAGRKATGSDGILLGQTRADLVTILMGFNDYHQNTPRQEFETNLRATVDRFRHGQPTTPLGVITPLWSNAPPLTNAGQKLEEYREVIRRVVSGLHDDRTRLIEGLDLMPPDATLFKDGIHPNDRGFKVLAKSLEAALEKMLAA